MNDTDDEGSESENEDDDGMVLDEMENEFHGQEGNKYLDFDGDNTSLKFGDSEDEYDNDSVMMVSCFTSYRYILMFFTRTVAFF